jgi:hypothetical protein
VLLQGILQLQHLQVGASQCSQGLAWPSSTKECSI